MTALTEPIEVMTGGPRHPSCPRAGPFTIGCSLHRVICRSNLSVVTFAHFGSYAKGTAHSDSDVNIALLSDDFSWDKLADVGGAQTDPESALNREGQYYGVPTSGFCGEDQDVLDAD